MPLFVSVPPVTASCALLPEASPLVNVIAPALMNPAAAVASAFSPPVLSTDSDCPEARFPLSVEVPWIAIALAPAPV